MQNLKVWWVLGWNYQYPEGGLENVVSTHFTKEEATAVANNLKNNLPQYCYDCVAVINISNMIGL